MGSLQGFWSYVHKDDEAERERISNLARDVVAQYELLTGETIYLFLDKDALEWGDNWRGKIDTNLASVAFFVPVMTPRYFMSTECRRELRNFARRANQQGVKELVLPLYYADIPALTQDPSKDDLIDLVRNFQWEDWRDLRFADVATERYRRAVAGLASRLVAANNQAEHANAAMESATAAVADGNDLLGHFNRMAESVLPGITEITHSIARETEAIGRVAQEATSEIKAGSAQGQNFYHRNAVIQRLAKLLVEPTEKMSTLANLYVSQLDKVDDGFRAIIEQLPAAIEQMPEFRPGACGFLASIRSFSASINGVLDLNQATIGAMTPLELTYRELRPVLRRLRQGLTILGEARRFTDDWVNLIGESAVDCPNMAEKEE